MADVGERHLAQQADSVRHSAAHLERSAAAVEDSADRRTQLAADRTVLAAERTYAAWVRTGLASLASGVGARALFPKIMPAWLGGVTGSILIAFSIFCFVCAVWRELDPGPPPPRPDTRRLPRPALIAFTAMLFIMDVAALIGIWLPPG